MYWHHEAGRVAWVDTDASGRIHYSSVFRWVEAAEMGLFRVLGFATADALDYPRRHVEAEYLVRLSIDDVLDVAICVAVIGTTSARFDWEVRRREQRAVIGSHTVVHVDDSGRPVAIDARTRRLLNGPPAGVAG